MKITRWLVFFGLLLVAGALATISCGGSSGNGDGGVDSGHESGKSDAATEASPDTSGPPILVQLSVTAAGGSGSLALSPTFSSSIFDYYVRCTATTKNQLTVSMQANTGSESQLVQPTSSPQKPMQTISPVSVVAGQLIVAQASKAGFKSVPYYVRCLPPDFPNFQWEPHPSAGTPPPGYYILGNYLPTAPYAFVLDSNGVPIWYHYEASKNGVVDVDNVIDATVSYVPGQGTLPFELYAIDKTPSESNAAPIGPPLDIHDFQVLPNGDYIIISNPIETGVDLTGLSPTMDSGVVPGKNSFIEGCEIVEFEPKTGKIVWTWDAKDHLNPIQVTEHLQGGGITGDASVPEGGTIWDVFHCNSVDVDHATGNLLVSGQLIDSFVYVEHPSGKVLWKMGGSKATIDKAPYIPNDSPFNGQHDVRLLPGWSMCTGGSVSLYDDNTFSTPQGNSRAVLFTVQLGSAGVCDGGSGGGGPPSAMLAFEYKGSTTISASGSFRVSKDGSHVIGWGITNHLMTEVDDKGHDLLDITSVSGLSVMQSYRAIKVPLTAFNLDELRANAGAKN